MEANTIAALWGAASAAVFSLVINLLFRYVDHYREKIYLAVGIKAEIEICKKSIEASNSHLNSFLNKDFISTSLLQSNYLSDLVFIDIILSKIGVFNEEAVKKIVLLRGSHQLLLRGLHQFLSEILSLPESKMPRVSGNVVELRRLAKEDQERIMEIIAAHEDLSDKCDLLIADLDKVQSSVLSRFI